jgi:hypothetical protein
MEAHGAVKKYSWRARERWVETFLSFLNALDSSE